MADLGVRVALRHGRRRIDKGAAAKYGQIDRQHHVVSDAKRPGHGPCGVDFTPVPLAVINREGREPVALGDRPGRGGGGVEAAGE